MKKSMVGLASLVSAVVFAGSGFAAVYAANVGAAGNVTSALRATVGNAASDVNANVGANAGASSSMMSSSNTSVSAGLGLQAEIQSGTVTTSSDSDVVNLQGNAAALIQNDADLSAYENLVVAARPAVKNVSVKNDDTVAITYAQPAKFLWVFPVTLTGEVDVNATGSTSVHLPWYAFLYSADTSAAQAAATVAVQHSGADLTGNAQASSSAALENKARIVNAVTAALQAQADATANANVSTNANANVQGTGSVTGQ